LDRARAVHVSFHPRAEVQLCTLLSVKTGGCPEDCAYCPQSAHYETSVKGEALLQVSDVIAAARRAKDAGSTRFCMGAAWREVKDGPAFDRVVEMIEGVKALGLEACVTLGMLSAIRKTFALVKELRSRGVAVLDVLEGLPTQSREARFLVQDTHWTPAFMQQVSRQLAGYVSKVVELPPLAAAPSLRAAPQPASRVGDLVDMLKLPEGQAHFQPQSVQVSQVQDDQGKPWEPDANADVLLLGDSFTNIFSLEGMGWGASAGLAPQLALALGRPVDVIAQNDSGAFATRLALQRELSGGIDRLAGKRVVVWEFASRELSVGDWKPLAWPGPAQEAK